MLSRLALLFLPVLALAQQPATTTSFVGVYGSFSPSSRPVPSAGVFGATAIKGIWTAAGYDFTWSRQHGLTNTTWGFPVLQTTTQWGTKLFVIAAPGLSLTATAPATTTASLSFVGGLMAELPRARGWVRFIEPLLAGTTITKGSAVDALEIKLVWSVLP